MFTKASQANSYYSPQHFSSWCMCLRQQSPLRPGSFAAQTLPPNSTLTVAQFIALSPALYSHFPDQWLRRRGAVPRLVPAEVHLAARRRGRRQHPAGSDLRFCASGCDLQAQCTLFRRGISRWTRRRLSHARNEQRHNASNIPRRAHGDLSGVSNLRQLTSSRCNISAASGQIPQMKP